jgi:hypothetical protein
LVKTTRRELRVLPGTDPSQIDAFRDHGFESASPSCSGWPSAVPMRASSSVSPKKKNGPTSKLYCSHSGRTNTGAVGVRRSQ